MLTIEQARNTLEDRGYKLTRIERGGSRVYTGEAVTIELHIAPFEQNRVVRAQARYGAGGVSRRILCKTPQQFLWVVQVFELESSAYHGDWAMCEEVLGCR